MSKPRVLILPDVPGWATATIANEIIKHLWPKFEFTVAYSQNMVGLFKEDLEDFDLVYPMLIRQAERISQKGDYEGKLATSIHGWRGLEITGLSSKLDKYSAVSCVSDELCKVVAKMNNGVWLTQSGVNSEFYSPAGELPKDFKVLWAGNPKHFWKRAWMLDLMNGPIMTSGGVIPKADMPDFYREGSVYVNPSLDEGGPLTVLEAMACGLPVISTRVGIAQDILDPDWIIDDGVYWKMSDIEIIDAFNELIGALREHPDMQIEVGMRNREVAEEMTWELSAEMYGNFLEAALR